LLEDQASALAFKFDGTLIVGTQCHGLAIFNRNEKGEYKHAKNIVAPDRVGLDNCSPVPLVPMGVGLPSNLINDIIVTKNNDEQTIWIATNAGLVKANESLTKLEYWRGKDYADKVRGFYGGAPKDWKEAPKEVMDQLLTEDCLTCLDEDEQGVVWIGTRQNGTMVADPQTGKESLGNPKAMDYPDSLVTKILNLNGGDYIVGFYGGGVVQSMKPFKLIDRKPAKTKFNKGKIFSVAQNNFPQLPSRIKLPTAEELRAMYYKLQKIHRQSDSSKILELNDDWRTQGDWIDRYGNHSTVLCGQAGGGLDFFDGYFQYELKSRAWIGRNHSQKNDQIRRWVHFIESNDKRVLQCLTLGGRKQSEWDDHKEAYPMSLDGPHVYGTFKLPAGRYILSLYFFNKDGHNSTNRMRDYIVSVKTFQIHQQGFDRLGNKNIYVEKEFIETTPNVTSRVCNFWGGVYKRFYVAVDAKEYVTIKVDANYSFNTIISGVFFDPACELKSLTLLDSKEPPSRKLTKWEEVIESPVEEIWWGVNAIDYLFYLRDRNPVWFYRNSRKKILPLIRNFVSIKDNKPYSPAKINVKDKELIRRDVASMLYQIQMMEYRDCVNHTSYRQATYWWNERSRVGRANALSVQWNEGEYMKFLWRKNSETSW
jgi:hypothetical protein